MDEEKINKFIEEYMGLVQKHGLYVNGHVHGSGHDKLMVMDVEQVHPQPESWKDDFLKRMQQQLFKNTFGVV